MRRAKEILVKNILRPSAQQFVTRAIEKLLVVGPDIEKGSFGVKLENDLIDGVDQCFEPRLVIAIFSVARRKGRRRIFLFIAAGSTGRCNTR
jgi:hypothetical protein